MKTVQDMSFGTIPVYKDKNGNFLFCLVKHSSGQHWGFPKGHKDNGETDEKTARRELFEEIGINSIRIIPHKEFFEYYSFEKNGVHYQKKVKYFICFTDTTEIHTQENFKNEIIDARWVTFEELLVRITFPEAKEVAKDAYAYLLSNA